MLSLHQQIAGLVLCAAGCVVFGAAACYPGCSCNETCPGVLHCQGCCLLNQCRPTPKTLKNPKTSSWLIMHLLAIGSCLTPCLKLPLPSEPKSKL